MKPRKRTLNFNYNKMQKYRYKITKIQNNLTFTKYKYKKLNTTIQIEQIHYLLNNNTPQTLWLRF